MVKDIKSGCSPENGCDALIAVAKKVARKVSWPALGSIAGFVAGLVLVGTYLFGAEVINMVKDAPEQDRKIEALWVEVRDVKERRAEIKALRDFATSTIPRLQNLEKQQEKYEADNKVIIQLLNEINNKK